MTFDIGVHEVCVPTGVRYVITKFSGMDSLPNFLTHGAPLRARELRYYKIHAMNSSQECRYFRTASNKRTPLGHHWLLIGDAHHKESESSRIESSIHPKGT